MTTPDELERAVERVQHEVDDVADAWRHCRIAMVNAADTDDVVGFPSFTKADLRLLLSERAELLATVERMRGGLKRITTNYGPGHLAHQIARAALTTGEDK